MKVKPSISIVIPLYNKSTSIALTINSLLNQSFSDFELIIVDDGSTDNSFSVVSRYVDTRIQVFKKNNTGVSDTRNFGIKKSIGNYIFLIDADDIALPNCLQVLFDLTKEFSNENIYCGNFSIVNAGVTVNKSYCSQRKLGLYTNSLEQIWKDKIFPRTGTLLFKRECFDDCCSFNVALSYYEDLDFILKITKANSIVYTPEVIFQYVLDNSDLSQKVVSVDKDFCFNVKYKGRGLYEILIISELLFNNVFLRLKRTDYKGAVMLVRNNVCKVPFSIIAKVYKKIFF